MKTIFFNMNQLGDLLFSLPVIKSAKESGELVGCIVKRSLAPILISSNLADIIIPKDQPFFSILSDIKKNNFDRAILFSESPKSLCAAFLSKVKERIGFQSASLSFLLTKKVKRSGVPSLFNNKNLAQAANLKNIKANYTDIIKIPQENLNYIEEYLKKNKIKREKIIAISCGTSAKRQDKNLSKNLWADIIDGLFAKNFIPILSGASFEKDYMSEISVSCHCRPQIFCAENGILDSAAFLKLCPLFLGIDSGAMHLSASVGTKCIGIFTKTDPLQIGPMPLEKHIIIKKEKFALTAKDILDALP